MRTTKAWAIRCGLTDFDREMLACGRSQFTGHGLLGVYGDYAHANLAALAALNPVVTTRLFHTRAEARAFLPKVRKSGWPHARVVPVVVEVREV